MTLPDYSPTETLLWTPPSDDPTAIPEALRIYVSEGGALLREVAWVVVDGLYTATFPELPQGVYWQRIAFTGLYGPDSYEAPLTLPVTSGHPVTIEELRSLLDLGPTDESDVALQETLDAAVRVVEGEVGPLTPTTVTETLSGNLLARWPVLSVATAGVVLGRGGAVTVPYGSTEVTYTYGRLQPTPEQRLAVLLVAKDLWDTRRGQGFPDDDTGQYVAAPILHRRVRELLAPTRLGPSVA